MNNYTYIGDFGHQILINMHMNIDHTGNQQTQLFVEKPNGYVDTLDYEILDEEQGIISYTVKENDFEQEGLYKFSVDVPNNNLLNIETFYIEAKPSYPQRDQKEKTFQKDKDEFNQYLLDPKKKYNKFKININKEESILL